jgi:hypothetical protein
MTKLNVRTACGGEGGLQRWNYDPVYRSVAAVICWDKDN